MFRISLLAAFASLALLTTAAADETGLAGLHDMKIVNKRLVCMTTHFHDGHGSGKTRKLALQAAAKTWMEFTAWEYGSNWASFKRAASKSERCVQTAGKTGMWSCNVSARPCKRYVKRRSKAKSASR